MTITIYVYKNEYINDRRSYELSPIEECGTDYWWLSNGDKGVKIDESELYDLLDGYFRKNMRVSKENNGDSFPR